MSSKKDLLNAEELGQLATIVDIDYMKPPIEKLDNFISTSKLSAKKATLECLDYIERFMQESKEAVGEIQQSRKDRGEVTDLSQSGKSIAGNMFANLLIYVLLKNKAIGNIHPNIFFTKSRSGAEKILGEDFNIYIGRETQKPDCDMVIYNKDNNKFMILSLKTSMRERAGQTFKWKLLWEIANSSNTELKEKFDISYKGKVTPRICFITADFYHEIYSHQHRGMFKFFDGSFIARPKVVHDLVLSLSELPEFIKKSL